MLNETDPKGYRDSFLEIDEWQVQAADSLLKLVSDLKQTAIFSGFASLNDHVEQRRFEFNQLTEKTGHTLRLERKLLLSWKNLNPIILLLHKRLFNRYNHSLHKSYFEQLIIILKTRVLRFQFRHMIPYFSLSIVEDNSLFLI
jgi:hypothetical protein